MRKRLLSWLSILVFSISLTAQDADDIKSRLILIGDAGEMDMQQGGVIKHAVTKVINGKTNVFYLGDNIYPTGMGLPGSKDEIRTQEILKSQFIPFRAAKAPVFFIPGNHDWDKSGPSGLAKIQRQGDFLKSQNDPQLSLIPGGGCPGPVEISLGEDLVLIAFDSEWWLFPHNKVDSSQSCTLNTEDDIIKQFETLIAKNKHKTIILASHHPFQTYGSRGGYYSWKDHLFPLTAVNHNLYIPLPVLGSMYPIARSLFKHPEDRAHQLYSHMVNRIDSVFQGTQKLVYVAGHDHGLQFIKNKRLQVVSGSGAKHSYVRKGKDALYASTLPGYVVIDQLLNNYLRFTYYAQRDGTFELVFETECRL